MRGVWATGIGVALAGASIVAAAEPKSSERVLQDFAMCRSTADPAARLACFEKTFDGFEAAVKARDVTIVDKQDMRQARRSLFGYTLPKVDLFSGQGPRDDRAEEDFTEINTTVASARQVENGRVEMRLADESGAVWRTTDPMTWPPKPGDKVRIRAGVMGNYFIATGGRTHRGMRVR